MTVQDFLIEANKRYVTKIRILANMFKIGYQDTETLECRMRLANSYLNVLSRLAGDYALTDEQIEAVMGHLIILLEIRNIIPPTVEDFRTIVVIQGDPIVITTQINVPPMRLTYRYSIPVGTRVDVDGVVYSTEVGAGDSSDVVVTVTHGLNKKNATIEVVNADGDRVYPGIRYITDNQVALYFNNASTAVGTITISE